MELRSDSTINSVDGDGSGVASAGRRESASLFLFRKNDGSEAGGEETDVDVVARERERVANQQKAKELADAEQQRRVDEVHDREDEVAIVRQINIELSKTAQDEEQARRVREYEVAKVQEQLLRERSKSDAVDAAEQERLRRIAERDDGAELENQERTTRQATAVLEMEKERVRRLSSQEHFQHMAARRKSRSRTTSQDDGAAVGSAAAPALFTDALRDAALLVSPPSKHLNDFDDADDDAKDGHGDGNEHGDGDEHGDGNDDLFVGDNSSDFSEIPVVHAHASKILVDEHTEWRCFIASDDPETERDSLRALRASLEDDLKIESHATFQELVGDVRLLRFLRGHKLNVAVAATKFREMLALRKTLKLDEIRTAIVDRSLSPDEFPHFQKIIPHLPFLHAYDVTSVDGAHVFYFEMDGYADVRGLVDDVTDDEWQTFFLYEMEHRALKLDQLSRKRETLVQTVVVRDLTGFAYARLSPRMLARVQQLLQVATTCYPETTYRTFVLHAPWVFAKVWHALASKLLDAPQARKIEMRGADAFAHLLALVGGRDKLPKLLGGRATTHAIPQTGLLGRDSFVLLCDDGATQTEIKAGASLQLPFRMSANDTICYEYNVEAHDVDFSVRFRTQGHGGAVETDKVPPVRTTQDATVAGSFTATEDGTVVLVWDNAFSWTRRKRVAYKAKVVKATHDFSCLDISGNDCV